MHRPRILLPLIVAAFPVCTVAHGQSQERIGNFGVERKADPITDEDKTFAGVIAQGGDQVLAGVTADGRVSLEGTKVTRTAHADLSVPAVFIVSQMTFPPGRARPVMVYVYFSPTGGHVQVQDPG